MTTPTPTTILFADVSGSTKLFEMRGDVIARGLIATVLQSLGEIAKRHGGRTVKTIGDEIMCVFPGAVNGLLASVDMQKRVAHDPAFMKENLAIRIGLHHGEALHEADGDVYGDAVNTAARMASLAKREQIVTTQTTAQATPPGAVRTRGLGTARVSGKLQPIEIVDIIWQEDTSNVTTVQRAIRLDNLPTVAQQRLVLRYRGKQIELTPTSPPYNMGRDASCGQTIDAEWVSRTHATIEFKRGYFMLTDRSTNGTWVKLGNDDELRLHRDEIHLRKTGIISLGQATAANKEDLLSFECIG